MPSKRYNSDIEDETATVLKKHKQDFKKMSEENSTELQIDDEDQNIDAALLEQDNEKGIESKSDNDDNEVETSHHDDAAVAAAVASAAANYDQLIDQPDTSNKDENEEENDNVTLTSSTKKDNGVDEHSNLDDKHTDDEDNSKNGVAPSRRGRKPMADAGTAEWKQQRKDSHKEVERRRRENINTAINKLSELLPVKESSKATILARAAEYIQKLKETENANIEKWTLQKLVNDQNSNRLINTNEKLQEELGNAYKEIESLKKKLTKLGKSSVSKEPST